MKILVTNDDSIKSPGLHMLASLARKYGDVFVIAPAEEQSAKSHGIDIRNGLKLEKFDFPVDLEAYSLTSTPADCVRVAHFALNKDFDIVFSGINNGLNIGEDIAYSGTVAAASEATFLNKKGIAFSAHVNDFDVVSKYFDEVMDFVFENKLLEVNDLYNINFPKNPKGIKWTKQGSTHFDTKITLENGMYFQRGRPMFEKDINNEHSDVAAIFNDYISITPLTNNRTDFTVLKKFIK